MLPVKEYLLFALRSLAIHNDVGKDDEEAKDSHTYESECLDDCF